MSAKMNTSVSSLDAATSAVAEGLLKYQANPEMYEVYFVQEAVGVPKKGSVTDFMIKATLSTAALTVDIVVPKSFLTKNGKLAVKEMGVKGAKIAARQQITKRERTVVSNGVRMTKLFAETDFVLVALLP
jgi:hypothetical protein